MDSDSKDWTFHQSWEEFLRSMRRCLVKQASFSLTDSANKVIDELLDMPRDQFDDLLREFSLDHRDESRAYKVYVSSETILDGLESEMVHVSDSISREDAGAKECSAVAIVTQSLTEILTSLPQWLKNSLTFLGEVFDLLALKGSPDEQQ